MLLKRPFQNNIKFISSNEISDIQNSDLIIVCVGLFASAEEKAKYKTSDKTGRNIQSFKNYPLIKQIAQEIKKYALHSNVLMITNQSDMMSELARTILPKQNVYGVGCYLDTLRFKKIFSQLTHSPFEAIKATILGFHDQSMFLDKSSFSCLYPFNQTKDIIQTALHQTILRGKELSDMQKDIHHPSINSGSSKLPAAALFNIVESYTQKNTPLCIPLNRVLCNEEKERYELDFSFGAQLMCQITHKEIKPIPTQLNISDINLLKQGLRDFEQNFNSFNITYFDINR
ncbi:MAG: hypothetical protein IJS26_04455 [Alphaproteobacteria bacterium]|nr:hypothetical protein [Alphaproteobacteria bacterium]